MCLIAAHRLDLFSIIARTPMNAGEIAASIEVKDSGRLIPILDYLACIGVLEERGGVYYSNGLTSDFCDQSGPYPWMLELVAGQYVPAFLRLSDSVNVDSTAFELAFGQNAWQMRREHPVLGDLFQTWLDKETSRLAGSISREWEWSRYPAILDVAGGMGALAQAIAERYPCSEVSVFETPEVADQITLDKSGSDRLKAVISGDFFDAIPEGYDAYIMKSILHDWPDKKCTDLLMKIETSMGSNAKLLVIERMYTSPSSGLNGYSEQDRQKLALNLRMLVVHGGKERSFRDYVSLFASAGLKLLNEKSLLCGFHIFELSR